MQMTGLVINVKDDVTATKFLKACCERIGRGFHPDTNMNTYICLKTGKRTFTKENAKFMNKQINACFNILPLDDIYSPCLEFFETIEHAKHHGSRVR